MKTTKLLDRWHGGDDEGLNELLRAHLPWIRDRVHARIGPYLRQKGETGDFVQETILEFLRYGPRFRVSSGGQFRALLATIAENVLRGNHRWWTRKRRQIGRERSASVVDLDPPRERVSTPSEVVQREEDEARIRLGLELLGPTEREVIILKDYDGLSHAEIGSRLGASEEAARKRYRRALASLSSVVGHLQETRLKELIEEQE